MRNTLTLVLLLLAAAMFAYPVLRGEGVTQYTVYGEDQFELIEEIDLGDEPVVVLRAPATEHALGEVTILPRPKYRLEDSPNHEYILGYRYVEGRRSPEGYELLERFLYTPSGSELWTVDVPDNRDWFHVVSDLGITCQLSEDCKFIEWRDTDYKLLNSYPMNPYIDREMITPMPTNGYWLICERPVSKPYAFANPDYHIAGPMLYSADFRYTTDESNFPSQSGVTIFDSQGNMMKQVEFGCGNVSFVECSPSGAYFIVAAHPKNILMSIDGHIIREFQKSGGVFINFSPSEDLAILGGPLRLVVDLETGEIIAEIFGSFQESSALSNKEAGIVAVTSGGNGIHVYDIWAEKQIARFRKDGGNIQLSGDGQLLSFRTWGKSNKLYTYLLDDKGGE